jgi:hypothetical protein
MHNFDARAFYTKWIRDIYGAKIQKTAMPQWSSWQPVMWRRIGLGCSYKHNALGILSSLMATGSCLKKISGV